MEETKPFWASRTLWVNFVAIVAAVLGTFGLGDVLDPEFQATVVAAVMGIVNIILRFVTTKPVTLTQTTEEV